jgi:hypothetical protein
MGRLETIRKKLWAPRERDDVPPLGTRETIAHWLLDEDDDGNALKGGSLIELVGYGRLLEVLPDKVVENLEKARLARDGRMPMLKAGLGYVELLVPVIVDPAAIASSSAETRLFPAILIPANYMQPGGIPGRSLRMQVRGRHTTLTTAATITFRNRIAATDIITGTILAASGAITMDTTIQTATMWEVEEHIVARSVGTAGTVFAMGDCAMSGAALTIANQQAVYMGSAGSATPATAAWDMTVPQFLQLTAQWSLTTAYSIQGHQYFVEALN